VLNPRSVLSQEEKINVADCEKNIYVQK